MSSFFQCCNLCDQAGKFEDSEDVAEVFSDVRRFRDEKFTVWRCPGCQSLHCKESIDLDYYYQDYFLQNQQLGFHLRIVFRNYLKRMRKFGLQRERPILDYGCGSGAMLTVLRENGFTNVSGYDRYVDQYSDPAVLKPSSYEAVISSEVIEHVEDPAQFLQEMAALVRPGGLVAVATPNALGIDLQPAQRFHWGLHQPFHRHILSTHAIEPLGRRAGLSLLSLTCRNWDTLWPSVNLRFFVEYVRKSGGFLDVNAEAPRVGMVLTSPRLLFFALYGYFFSPRSAMLAIFRKSEPS